LDPILQTLLSWQFMLFSLAIATVVWVIRTIVEYILDSPTLPRVNSKMKAWREIILPLLPIFVGTVFAFFITSFPYPNGLTSASSRIIFGLVAGSVSGILYRVLNSILASKITSVIQDVQAALPAVNTTTTTIVQTPASTTTQQIQVNSVPASGDNIPQDQLPNRGQQ
jgi:hypothetical protein